MSIELSSIREIVTDVFDVPLSAFVGPGRAKRVVDARAAFAYLARTHSNETLCSISLMCVQDGRSPTHSVIIDRDWRARLRLQSDPDFARMVHACEERILAEKAEPVTFPDQSRLVNAILTELACQGIRSVSRDQAAAVARAADSIIAAMAKEAADV